MSRCALPSTTRRGSNLVVFVVVTVLLLSGSDGREFRPRRNNVRNNGGSVVTVPDTGNIDNEVLKSVSADKFLSLWFIFVLGGPTTIADSNWTLFVPLNTGLPGPGVGGFLSDKDATRDLLMNHVLLGSTLQADQLPPAAVAPSGLATEGGTTLEFSHENGESYVNGIRLTGDQTSVPGGTVIVIESYLPVQKSETDKTTVDDASGKASTTSSADGLSGKLNEISRKSQLLNKGKQSTDRRLTLESGDTITLATEKPASRTEKTKLSSNLLSRQSRFDKFRKNERIRTFNGNNKKEIRLTANETLPIEEGRPVLEEISTESESRITETVTALNEEESTTELAMDIVEERQSNTETVQTSLVEKTTLAPSSTPDIFAMFGGVKRTTAETPQVTSAPVTEATNIPETETETETTFLAFEKFVKTTTNGKEFFAESENQNDSTRIIATTNNSNGNVVIDEHSETDTEFLPESDFVPFNEFLNSQSAKEKLSEAFEVLPEDIKSEGADQENKSFSFLSWLQQEVATRLQLGGKEFLNHLLKSGVADLLLPNQQYTALMPTDEAFYAYYPIDWGFNPFLVENFLRRTLREHLLEGDIALENLTDGAVLSTLAGTTLVLQNTEGGMTVAGIPVLKESEVTSEFGRIYSLPRLLHVTDQTVKLLREMNPHLERAPLLSSPWPMSQFLSHLLDRCTRSKSDNISSSTALFAQYLSQSHLSHLVPSSDEDFNQLEYTALVPTDEAIMADLNLRQQANNYSKLSTNTTDRDGNSSIILEDSDTEAVVSSSNDRSSVLLEDPYMDDLQKRNQLVGSHILRGRHTLSSLRPGTTVTTLLNDTLNVTRIPGVGIAVGGAQIVPPGQSIYNLGAMFLVRGPLILRDGNKLESTQDEDETNVVVDASGNASNVSENSKNKEENGAVDAADNRPKISAVSSATITERKPKSIPTNTQEATKLATETGNSDFESVPDVTLDDAGIKPGIEPGAGTHSDSGVEPGTGGGLSSNTVAPRVVTRTEVSVSRSVNGKVESVPTTIAHLIAARTLR